MRNRKHPRIKSYGLSIFLVLLVLALGTYTYLFETSSISAKGYISFSLFQTPQQDSYVEPYIENQYREKTSWGYEYTLHSSDVVEVGDKATPDFKPYVKLGRWDNEVWLSLYYPTIAKTPAIEVDANKISWNTPSTGFNFYSQEPTDLQGIKQNEKGGFEFEIVLYEKPLFNTINLNFNSSGLDFYRQPPLTSKYKSGWSERWQDTITVTETTVMGTKSEKPLVYRPENVVGSYAVYHSTKDGMYPSKAEAEQYKAGKAFHIYRPLVNGEIWADLYIDQEAGQMSLIIPQFYIDNPENYPMVIDPQFGYEGVGGSSENNNADDLLGYRFTTPADCTSIDSIKAYGQGRGANAYFKGIVVTLGEVIPANGIGAPSASQWMNGVASWEESTFGTPPTVTANTDYFLTYITDEAYKNYYDAGTANYQIYDPNSYDNPVNPSGADYYDSKYFVYATYTATGACSPDIANSPTGYDFGVLAESSNASTGLTNFTITNSSGGSINVTIQATDMVGGNTWTCSDNGGAGDMKVGFKAGLGGASYNITVKKNSPYNLLVAGFADSSNQSWGLQIFAPYNYTDGVGKSGNVTLTAACE